MFASPTGILACNEFIIAIFSPSTNMNMSCPVNIFSRGHAMEDELLEHVRRKLEVVKPHVRQIAQ